MPLHVKASEMKEYQRDQSGEAGTGQMVVRKGYGNECSLMIATRRPGYHTKPHQHESEQINYVMDGEIWFFVKDHGFLCKKGDFHRIPANTVHWAFNRSDKDAQWPKPMRRVSSAGAPEITLWRSSTTAKHRSARPRHQSVRPLRSGKSRSQVLRQVAPSKESKRVSRYS